MRYLTLIATLAVLFSQPASASCKQPEYRAFDFWLGHWQVTTSADDIVRHNRISKINQGCTLLEEYSTPSGYVGKSLNIYDRQSKQWHQTWTDSSGILLQLTGNLIGENMVLQGTTVNQKQQTVVNRITWSKNNDGSVRQHWQSSVDQGKNWQTVFDGHYEKIKP